MGEKKGRLDYLELLRFVASVLIIGGHAFNLGFSNGTYPFATSGIFVEFFLIVTGFFTTAHFAKQLADSSLDARMGDSLRYTLHKFVRFLPYSCIVILADYTIRNLQFFGEPISTVLYAFRQMPFEMLYFSCATEHGPWVGPLWYLSAMFLVFPIFCLLIQTKNRNILKWVSFIVPVFYYSYFGASGLRAFPHDLVRTFSCMLIGTCICLNMGLITRICDKIKSKLALTTIEVCGFGFACVASYCNASWAKDLCLLGFIVSLSILFARRSYTSQVSSPLLRWLGELSLPIFLWNWTIGTGIRTLWPDMSLENKLCMYSVLTLLIPIVTLYCVKFAQWVIRNRSRILALEFPTLESLLSTGKASEQKDSQPSMAGLGIRRLMSRHRTKA